MEYVKVVANSQSEALLKVRQLYGPDAYLFEEKWIEPDTFLGKLFGKKQYQITVALREKNIDNTKNFSKLEKEIRINPTKKTETTGKEEVLRLLEEIRKNRLISNETPRPEAKDYLQPGLQKIARDIEIIKQNISAKTQETRAVDFFGLKEALFRQNFSESFIEDFLADLRLELAPNDYRNFTKIFQLAKGLLEKRIRVSPGLGRESVIALIGPTGVGKTTTIAKIAAELALRRKRRVELITLDNFRIAATEQLKVYGNIMGVPVTICLTVTEFKRAIEQSSAEFILVDNTGFAASNDKFLQEQKAFYEAIPNKAEKHLVVPANMKTEDAELVMENFSKIGYDKVILSKTDESQSFGSFVELANKYHRPFSFFTTGQNVPDDILEARSDFLAEKILERWRQKAEIT